MKLSVILPTHRPHAGRLAHALGALRDQTLPSELWELLVVDNDSSPTLALDTLSSTRPARTRVVHEPRLGLSYARRRGFSEARGDLFVLVDDDNVLAPDYLAHVVRLFDTHPDLGAAGGPSRPEFESAPPPWASEFFPLLALRDLGATPILAGLSHDPTSGLPLYPHSAPIGAGMALRASALSSWLSTTHADRIPDRQGATLSSGGDNDIIFTILRAGWTLGYFPQLALTHLIPDSRLAPDYLCRLNQGVQESWIRVLAHHRACPWPPLGRWSLPLREIKAWFVHRAWAGPAERIRWHGARGHFRGRAAIRRLSR